ncbi:hypothetical protein NCC49_001357 [Naganishia albida]|nr:hypothetical protein NCC49_001357 [Naganishia albida]
MSPRTKRTQIDRFERYYPYLRFVRDLAFSLADIFSQCTTIRPWYLVIPILALKLFVVISHTFGNNIDHHVPKGVDGLLVIRGKRGCWLFEGDTDEEEREKRMGVLGQPECAAKDRALSGKTLKADHTVRETPHPNSTRGEIRIAVVCPVYISDTGTDTDLKALQRVHRSLRHQTRQPDLIVFVDDGSPILQHPNNASKPSKSSPSRYTIPPFPRLNPPQPRPDPYETLDIGTNTHVLCLLENGGPAAARNRGIDHAVAILGNDPGRTLVFLLDVDCVAPVDWIVDWIAAVLARRPGIMDDVEPIEPLIVGGLTYGISPSSFYSFYHDLFGTLNPRIIRVPNPNAAQYQPLYAPTCNMIILPGHAECSKKLPRFHEGFREAAQEDVLFCLEAVYGRGCELIMDKLSPSPTSTDYVLPC